MRVTIEEVYGTYRDRLHRAREAVAFGKQMGVPWLLRHYRLCRSLALHGIGWDEVERVGYRILGPAILLPRPGQAPFMVLDEASRAQREGRQARLRDLRFDARSRMGRRPPGEAALEDAQRLFWAKSTRASAFNTERPQRIRVELWGLLGDHATALYDLIAPRIREQRHAWTADGFDRLPVLYKSEALRLVARIVNDVYGGTLPRPFTRRDVRSRLQKRGRQADPRRRSNPRQDI